MDLQYKGMNPRTRQVEWVDRDLSSRLYPDGLTMEATQAHRYRGFVQSVKPFIGRELTKRELSTIAWLAGFEQSSMDTILNLIETAALAGIRAQQ